MLTSIQPLFSRQPDGKYIAQVKGFNGTVRIATDPAFYWVKVYTQKPGSQRTLLRTVIGTVCKFDLDIPVTTDVFFETERRPSEATIDSEAMNYVESVINNIVAPGEGEDGTISLASLQQQLNEQKRINETQQTELERNAAHDNDQQAQIDANTALNEAQERGIGEQATNDLINKVFGQKA